MQQLIATRGLPASGKSTWANEVCEAGANFVRVNRDDIRKNLNIQKWTPKREKEVMQVRDKKIKSVLTEGRNVIVDDTNISDKTLNGLRAIANQFEVEFVVNDSFMDVSVEECIKRDNNRHPHVGKDVIERMYYQYWEQQDKPLNVGDPAFICDLDGTLATIPKGANPYDRDFSKDGMNKAVAATVRSLAAVGMQPIFMSGREEKHRAATEEWLREHFMSYYDPFRGDANCLFMRETGDHRKDTIVKKVLWMEHCFDKYQIKLVLDDRPSVVRMWRAELGFEVFQVAPNIEF